ncbi:MAG: VRR-NUC domain-containing protein [Lachnospiraceae bacterium]|nr:VRR-NUC domain-containing protein [Lachnospiraceae bacterium]
MREKEIEEKFREAVKRAGGKAYKFVSPGNDGVPDRLVVMPGGHIGFVEVKAPGKKPTPLQHVRMRELLSLGCGVWVLDSLEGIDGVVAAVCQTSACEGPHLGGAEGKA